EGNAFPDLISAALHGAGISGEDLAFDFSDFDDGTADSSSQGVTDTTTNLEQQQILPPVLPIQTTQLHIPRSSQVVSTSGVQHLVTGHRQQLKSARPLLQTNQPMTVINPPHIRSQSAILPGTPRIVPQLRQSQTVLQQNLKYQNVTQSPATSSVRLQSLAQPLTPQGTQSFKIMRTPSGSAGAQGQPAISQTTPKNVRSQPIPRHLNRNMNNSVPSAHHIVVNHPPNNDHESSQVLKVTARGKAVTTEDITKIVSSLPNLKSGSKIIVNTTHTASGGSQATIQVVPTSIPQTFQMAPVKELTVQASSKTQEIEPQASLMMANPIISTLQPTNSSSSIPHNINITASSMSAPLTGIQIAQNRSQSPIVMANHPVKTKISRLPLPPGLTSPASANIINPPIQQRPIVTTQNNYKLAGNIPSFPDMRKLVSFQSVHQNGPLKMSMSSKDLSKAWNDHSVLRRVHSAQNLQRNLTRVPQDEEEIEEEVEELGHAETYAEYTPSKLNFGKKHPDPVVETSSLSSVEPPDIKYQLRILDECVDEGARLSALQLESITYASQRHQTILPNGQRAGYLIGDGAGVGKGRTIAGIIFENYLHRRKRALWLSVSNDLKVDAERDLRDIGAGHIDVYSLNKFKYYSKLSSKENNSCKKGVIFATYSSLIGESQAEGKYNTRLKQLLKWLGHDFEGVIVFDECHKAKNLCPTGSSKPTKTGQTVLELQNRLPKARVVYASATGASEPKNMAYMTRLGLWGEGTPFKEFTDFIQAVERRGVGAMELVAMDAKSRGMYIARQLSFHGVTFRIEEIPLEKDFEKVYNLAVEMWVEAREMFQHAAELIEAEHRMKKSMWGQFWSAHQRFFKYLCISAKVNRCVDVAREAVRYGKCVVIGLQSTGEARTLDQVEEAGGDLTDFVSTAKGVFQTLVDRHFPASTRGRALDIIKQVSNSHKKRDSPNLWKRKKAEEEPASKRQKKDEDSSDPDSNDSSPDISDIDFASSSDSSMSSSEDDEHNPFANGWNSDDDDPWCKKKKRKRESPKQKKKVKKKMKKDLKKEGKESDSDDEDEIDRALTRSGLLNKMPPTFDNPSGNWEKASMMKTELLSRIDYLGERLPPNTLDQLIDELGGPENVAEMTGRKSRVVSTDGGVQFESRSESDVPLEILNLTEKQRFMDGEKFIAIISEAASSGISLQADRRAMNQRRRVHITLELPWSADRAIQQFGRTHRSNQVSSPEYLFLISELAGERRFAATVAKRLESLGALTHGDRRATESRDLSRFNIDNKYGRLALEAVMKSVLDMQTDAHGVAPPKSYEGDFFKDVKEALVGVGMINIDPKTGYTSLEKDFSSISKFLNRILGMKVTVQNALFTYFTDTLTSIILDAKRSGRWDMGIMDLGSGEERVRKIETRVFVGNTATNTAKTELTKFAVERGMPWNSALDLWRRCGSTDEGFYCSLQDRGCRKTAILVVYHSKNKKREQLFSVHRPNTGRQARCETLAEIKKKYKKCLPDVAEPLWQEQYQASETQCCHRYWRGSCRKLATGQPCDFGLRTRFYHVLSGSVLSVWSKVESVLVSLTTSSRMQIIRLRTEDNQRIVGSLIPANSVPALERVLAQDSAQNYMEKHDNPFNYQPYIPGANSTHSRLFNSKGSLSSASPRTSINSKPIPLSTSSNTSVSDTSTEESTASTTATNACDSSLPAEEEVLEPPELLSMPTLVW
ncbi:protein strawberry notch homolog 1, partial [Plakobranchus ocellatus]